MVSLSGAAAVKLPGPKSHSRVHLVYFALASFDLVAVLAGLMLSSHFSSIFERTVQYRQGWDEVFSEMWELNDLVMETSAPVVELFETGDPVGKSKRFETNLKALEINIGKLQQTLIGSNRAEAAQDALAALHVVRSSLKLVAEHGRSAFSSYYNGWISKAAHCMSMTESFAGKLKTQFHSAMASILLLTRQYENKNIAEVRSLKRYEFVIAGVVLFMVAGITTYGHYIGRLIRKNHREISEAYDRLEASRADTLAFAARLQTVNEDVTRLNNELSAKMRQLQDAQEENIRKGKLAQLGQLTATVAHEIRNPLNTIRTAAYLVDRKLETKTADVETHLGRINKGITRCDAIISELLDFTRSRALQLETVEVDKWLEEVIAEQAQKLPGVVKVEFKPGLAGVSARFDPSRMYRVIVNFLTNASEAMVGKGEDPSKFTTVQPKIIVSTAQGSAAIEIACADNGPGIPDDVLAKIREPLFTTKAFGIGLGLPAIEKIMDEHGGKLRIETRVGEGTKMIACIPAQQEKRDAA
jgi:signal transduction histidine kinase